MAPDTTRMMVMHNNDGPVTLGDLWGELEVIHNERNNDHELVGSLLVCLPSSEVSDQLVARLRDGWGDCFAHYRFEPLESEVISLQRELAEARAEIESLKSRPSLTPLTDPSVRGVLVDDGEPTSVVSCHRLYLDESDGQLWQPKHTGECNTKWQPVKLRPASEFGVPTKPSAEVRFEANEGVPSFDRVQLAIDTLGYYGQFQQGQDGWAALCVLRAHLAALKSTPAEPAQKLVPLPEGTALFEIVLDRPKCGELWRNSGQENWHVAAHDWGAHMPRLQVLRKLDPAPYGVPATNKIKQLEADLAESKACEEAVDTHADKVIRERNGLQERVRELEAEVARLTKDNAQWEESCGLASESAGACQSEAERLRKAIETHRHKNTGMACDHKQSDLELWSALTPPTAASGEKQWHLDNEDREDLLELWNHYRTTMDQEECLSAAKAITEILENKPGQLLTLDGMPLPASAPAAESEGVKRKREPRTYKEELEWRLAACEERCRELEAGIARHRDDFPDEPMQGELELWSLLAPKAEVAG